MWWRKVVGRWRPPQTQRPEAVITWCVGGHWGGQREWPGGRVRRGRQVEQDRGKAFHSQVCEGMAWLVLEALIRLFWREQTVEAEVWGSDGLDHGGDGQSGRGKGGLCVHHEGEWAHGVCWRVGEWVRESGEARRAPGGCPLTKLQSLERAVVSSLLPFSPLPSPVSWPSSPPLSPCLLSPHRLLLLVPFLPSLLHPSSFGSPVTSSPQVRDTALQNTSFIHSADLMTSSGPRGWELRKK